MIEEKRPSRCIWNHLDLFFVSSKYQERQETPSTCRDTRPSFQEQHIQLSSEVTEGDQTRESATDDDDIVHGEGIQLTKYELVMLVIARSENRVQ